MAELEKLAAARLEKEASNNTVNPVREVSEDDVKDVSGETTVVTTSISEGANESLSKKEDEPALIGSNVPEELEGNSLEVQSAITTDLEKVSSTPTPSNAEKESPEATEVRIVEEGKLEKADPSVVNEELSKEILEDPEVVPSPAKMYTALKAVDGDMPVLKSENGNDGDTDANTADEDNENDEDDVDEDEDEDDADMDTAKALAELAMTAGKSGNPAFSGTKPSMGAAGPSLPSLPQRPAVRKPIAATASDSPGRNTQRPNGALSTQITSTTDESASSDAAEGDETREKLQNIRVKFLRLAHRLGQSPQNVVVAQVLYRLGLAESLRGGSAPNRSGAFSFDRANALAEEQEAANQEEELDFACTILVLGKTGVGKSSTINSIFDERKSVTSAFKPSTNKVQEVIGTVHGIKVRVIDTPGLLPSVADQQHNERIMGQVKKYIKKASPDIVLYFDRLDMQSRDFGDLPLLRTITDLFGAAVWFNAIVVLTHASSAPPDGPNGVPLSYEMFVAQRSHVVQQTIRQAAGDMRLMNPVSLVENHPACRTNRTGQRVLPNGQIWKPQLLLLCFASKILAEANSLLKLQETTAPGRPFGQRSRVPPLPFLLSSLLQSRAQLKLPDEQAGESDESDDDEEEEDSDADDYDELPPFRPLSKEELEDLTKEQREDYMEELADRERMFQKKQYREEIRRRKEAKKRQAQMSKEELAEAEEAEDEAGNAAAVPVPMPDMALPPSFDSDNPTHRYRYLETANQWLVRPVLETHGWDHDAGYDGFNVEKMFVVKEKIPASVSGQVTKDKKEAQVNFEAAASLRHGEGKVTLTGFDVQTIGKDLAYTVRAETRFNNFKRNKTTAGVTATYLNDTIAAGVKLEDRVLIGKRVKLVVNGGVLTGKGDKAYGGSLEATLRGKEYPLSRTLSTLGLSVMDWHGDLAIGGNLQSQFMVGKTMMVGRANLNNRGSGQVSIRASSSEQLQMVLIGIVPILRSLINCRFGFGGQSQQ
uniref:Translocase of chloroplast 108, chloroplastic n=1 Tax=Physcomitrium patens TaxID=3218 RepID=TC108_PHYPA|nr:RecName: Full=Translocase of chloroplast 108, chloroplastic; AltName: Full=108 kDa chloroplast outer envelope protein [Physcomitrium patens]